MLNLVITQIHHLPPQVLSLSNDQDPEARAISAVLLNGMAPTLSSEICQRFCAVQILALAEDSKAIVREAVLDNMKDIAECAGEKFCKGKY
jgi:hypothetical protein